MEELEKINNYLDNKIFFLSLENVVKNDILKFVD